MRAAREEVAACDSIFKKGGCPNLLLFPARTAYKMLPHRPGSKAFSNEDDLPRDFFGRPLGGSALCRHMILVIVTALCLSQVPGEEEWHATCVSNLAGHALAIFVAQEFP